MSTIKRNVLTCSDVRSDHRLVWVVLGLTPRQFMLEVAVEVEVEVAVAVAVEVRIYNICVQAAT